MSDFREYQTFILGTIRDNQNYFQYIQNYERSGIQHPQNVSRETYYKMQSDIQDYLSRVRN